jgi:hypothetical protein
MHRRTIKKTRIKQRETIKNDKLTQKWNCRYIRNYQIFIKYSKVIGSLKIKFAKGTTLKKWISFINENSNW